MGLKVEKRSLPVGVVCKAGKYYRRFRTRQDGKRLEHYVSLPDIDSPLFAEALDRANANPDAEPIKPTVKDVADMPPTFARLAIEFREAVNRGWTRKTKKKGNHALAGNTLRNYHRYIDMIQAELGMGYAADLATPAVYKIRDRMSDTPGKANNYLNVLKLMLHFGTERGVVPYNVAATVPLLPISEHEPWPRAVLIAALEKASPMLRLAIIMGVCTGQRLGDAIRIQHGWMRDGILEMKQQKTAVYAAVPVHPWLSEEIAKLPRNAITVLYDRSGKPFSGPDRIQERIRRLMHELGHVDDEGQVLYTMHGLRKNACCYLLEMGLSDSEVGLMLGMTTETVRHYGKQAKALMVAQRSVDVIAAGNVVKFGR